MGPRTKPEPVRSTELPEAPWQEIAIDLLEINSGNHLLVVVDYYSRWIEAILMRKTDAQHVIKSLEAIFRTHGLPEVIRSDNGPPFASCEFESFLEYLGIVHKKGVPYWPQSNGEVERCNSTLLKIVRIARVEGRDWRKALDDFLFHYRVTPHTVTGVSPAELLMGRKLRDKLPRVNIPEDQATEAEWQKLLKERDVRAKMRQKMYADKVRRAQPSDIGIGDRILLKKSRENKLSTSYEPQPYEVVHREGNAAIIQDIYGNNKMRGIAHMKKYVEPEMNGGESGSESVLMPEPSSNTELGQLTASSCHPEVERSVDNQTDSVGVPTPAVPGEPTVPPQSIVPEVRPVRTKRPPVWMKDYVLT